MFSIHNPQGERLDISYYEGQGEKAYDQTLVIIGHGVTENKDRSLFIAIAESLSAHGWPCLRFSFSGNGKSEGDFIDSNITKGISDLTAIIDQLGTDKKIAYVGHNIGGAVGALTAARDDRLNVLVSLAGMVQTQVFLEREFGEITPGFGNMREDSDFPLSTGYADDLHHINHTLNAVHELRLPWLLLHGLKDETIPAADSEQLLVRLRGPSLYIEIPDVEHSLENHYPIVCQEIRGWFKQYLC